MTDRARRSPLPKRFSWEPTDGVDSLARHAIMERNEANHTAAAGGTKEGRLGDGLVRGNQKGTKSRPGGSFLLKDAVGSGEETGHRKRHSRRLLPSIRHKGSKKENKKQSSLSGAHEGLGISTHADEPRSPSSTTAGPSIAESGPSSSQDTQVPQPESPPPLDVESAQIVDMALRISQSRRAASQRVVSQQTPPRLAPLPDTAGGVGSLRQHLLQQRKVSRTGSPRPRGASTLRHALDSFDVTAQDGSYRYHISRSTLARVQRAKEYMELMAQYRRLLGYLPPLRTGAGQQPPSTAASGSSQNGAGGRRYDPLQYIRNRKVRARERQPLDGEAQGFKDVTQVANWVDEVAEWSIAESQAHDGVQAPPKFAPAERQKNEVPSASEGAKAAAKLARRRIDWLIEPADLIADAYWLEQGNNKSLIQDRHWEQLYPSTSVSSLRPAPQAEERHVLSRPVTKDQNEEPDSKGKADDLLPHISPRSRLLRVGGALHRRQSSSGHNHDFLGLRRGSSDTEESEGDFKLKARTGTMTTSGKDILEKQMQEMIAREERERGSRSETSPPQPNRSDRTDQLSIHSQDGSLTGTSEPDDKGAREQAPTSHRPAHLTVEVPPRRSRRSLDETPPRSPDQPPSRDSYAGLSPAASRGASPSRNPFSKVKQYFGDRKDKNAYIDDRIREIDVDADLQRWAVTPPAPQVEDKPPIERRPSGSPTRKPSGRGSGDGKAHLRVSSTRTREDLMPRGIFRAPARIDNVLRTGASKISDIIWRKDDDTGLVSEGTMTDDSEERFGRGRAGSRAEDPHMRRSYLDQMPTFTPERPVYRHHEALSETRSSRRHSIQSGFSDGRRGPVFSPDAEAAVAESDAETEEAKRQGSPSRRMLPPSLGAARHFSYSQRTNTSRSEKEQHLPISRREIARLRALLLSSGVMAMEISRRANEPRPTTSGSAGSGVPVPWSQIAPLAPPSSSPLPETAAPLESYTLAARVLEGAVAEASHGWQERAEQFTSETTPALHARLDELRIKLAVDLSSTIRGASDEADETGREATQTQRLRVKRVVDVIEKMLRRRRRRFRWVRRAMWLGVEWVLVGFMWYVWFVVMVFRVVGGVGKGVVGGVRWLLWL